MTTTPDYYAYRTGAQRPSLDYATLKRLVSVVFKRLEQRGWYQQALGKDCVDDPCDIGARVLATLGHDLWPFSETIPNQEEVWLFTALEFTYDHVAKPTESWEHRWNSCGTHVTAADPVVGQADFRTEVNDLLARYDPPYQMATDGRIYQLAPKGLEAIEPPPAGDPAIDGRVASALRAFHHHDASNDDKRHAIQDLADILENLRETTGTNLPKKDENELFNIANNFGIRHHNPKQKTDYDGPLWLDWMYYSFLNSIHLICRMRQQPLP